ncbi:MAG: [acyl-carrier-protein] S-malonyltransferase, partial [Elusimicrobiota bacterium]|nr:[acyl-carrier-protein] S-malonyltransferase [Elusimicrobiota bacterium]
NDVKKIKNNIINQVNHSVQWIKTIKNLVKNGINKIIEVGPGKVLSALNKKIDKSIEVYNIENMETLQKTIDILK